MCLTMKIFDNSYFQSLISQAKSSPRLRQHRNIHQDYQDQSQRLFNALEPGSYIRPHRHLSVLRDELLIAIRGSMAFIAFNDQGAVTNILRFGTEKYGSNLTTGLEVPSSTWHTVVALEPGCILLEVKAGPFDPDRPKDLAQWAPEEGSDEVNDYMNRLVEMTRQLNG